MTRLTPELRVEIEQILRNSSTGLTHGEVFRHLERGLDAEQIAASRGTNIYYMRDIITSLRHLLDVLSACLSRG